MLTRLNLDLDSDLIRLPLPALCIRFPKDPARNPLKFEWQGEDVAVRCIMLGEINDGTGLSVLVDIGETMPMGVPIYTYRNFPRRAGLTVEQSLASLGTVGLFADIGVQVPDWIVTDCIRLCCSLCLLENDPSIISADVLADDRAKFEASGDQRFVDKAHRRGKIGWDVGKHIEVIPHFRRPHMALVWTGAVEWCRRSCPERAASFTGRWSRNCRAGSSLFHRAAVEETMQLIAIPITLLFFGWSPLAQAADLNHKEWKVDGVTREALVYSPTTAKTVPTPIVFAFHGHGGNMKYAATKFAFRKHWPEAIVVYMQGLNTPGAAPTRKESCRDGKRPSAIRATGI